MTPRPLDDTVTLGNIILRGPAHDLRAALYEVAADFACGQHEDPSPAYVAMVHDRLVERVFAAIESTRVESYAGFVSDREHSAAADLDATRELA